MSSNVFFSYSRDNSDFVLDLAKKLRKAGANVWLDQLDIATGERWDKSIERALASSEVLMVVLSKSSVESHNVMDEVSYALEEGKRVLPILYEECDVPFRLRRLQFADFTGDPEKGMEVLSKALGFDEGNVDAIDASTLSKSSASAETTPSKADAKAKSKTSLEPTTSSSKKRLPLYIGGALIALLAILYFSGVIGEDPTEAGLSAAIGENTVEGYIEYIANADSDYENVQEATNRLSALMQEVAQVVYQDPVGERWFEKYVFTDTDGIIGKGTDDGEPPRVGDILMASRPVEVYHPETKELIDTEHILEGQKVLVEDVDLATSDGYLYVYVSYEVLSNGGLPASANQVNTSKDEPPVEIPVTGLNIARANYNGGYFTRQSPGKWKEVNSDGQFSYNVRDRNKSEVKLYDPGRSIYISIDITDLRVYYSNDGNDWSELYVITEMLK